MNRKVEKKMRKDQRVQETRKIILHSSIPWQSIHNRGKLHKASKHSVRAVMAAQGQQAGRRGCQQPTKATAAAQGYQQPIGPKQQQGGCRPFAIAMQQPDQAKQGPNQKNLILVLALFKQGYSILFNKNIFIKLNGSFICLDKLVEIHDIEFYKLQKLSLKKKLLLVMQRIFVI